MKNFIVNYYNVDYNSYTNAYRYYDIAFKSYDIYREWLSFVTELLQTNNPILSVHA